jgi:hypothetical protein
VHGIGHAHQRTGYIHERTCDTEYNTHGTVRDKHSYRGKSDRREWN